MGKKERFVVVDGIKVHVTKESIDDFELTEALADSERDGATDSERTQAAVKFMRLLFGSDLDAVKRALRKRNNGRLTNQIMAEFASAVIQEVGAKN